MGTDIHNWAEVRTGIPTGENLQVPANRSIEKIRSSLGDDDKIMRYVNSLARPLDPVLREYLAGHLASWGEWVCSTSDVLHPNREELEGEFEDDPEMLARYQSVLPHGPCYIPRNYDLFNILAGVRGRPGSLSISGPRGLPGNLSPAVQRSAMREGAEAHSHSHLTLREILGFPWGEPFPYRGFVNSLNYGAFKREGSPWIWASELIPEGGHVVIPNAEMDLLGRGAGHHHRTEIEWFEYFDRSCPAFIAEVIPALQALGEPDDVRLVFWFDC